jgi:hypothetical protein
VYYFGHLPSFEMKKIYCLFVFKLDTSGQSDYTRSRCWGWSCSQENLEKSIVHCTDGLFEMGYYDHAFIEEHPEGLCRTAKVVKTFQAIYNPETQQYQVDEIPYPEWAKGSCNFSIG